MKQKILVILFAILFSSFSNEILNLENSRYDNGKVLLVQFEKETYIKIIKDFSKKKDIRWGTDGSPVFGPIYDSLHKELHIDGFLNISDSSRILFWNCSTVKDIALPYSDGEITIDNFINDSVVQFTLDNKKFFLSPGQIILDTIITIEKQVKKIIQYTEIYSVQNYGLISKRNVIDTKEYNRRANEEIRKRDSIDLYDLNQLEKKK